MAHVRRNANAMASHTPIPRSSYSHSQIIDWLCCTIQVTTNTHKPWFYHWKTTYMNRNTSYMNIVYEQEYIIYIQPWYVEYNHHHGSIPLPEQGTLFCHSLVGTVVTHPHPSIQQHPVPPLSQHMHARTCTHTHTLARTHTYTQGLPFFSYNDKEEPETRQSQHTHTHAHTNRHMVN